MTCHSKHLITKSQMSQLLILVLVICGHGLLMVLDVLIPILLSAFCPKSTLVSLPIFWLLKWNPQSHYPHLSMEATNWLASTIILSPNRTLPIVSYFEPIVVTDNKRCSILVQLVSSNWSVFGMDIWLALFIPNIVVNDGIRRFFIFFLTSLRVLMVCKSLGWWCSTPSIEAKETLGSVRYELTLLRYILSSVVPV